MRENTWTKTKDNKKKKKRRGKRENELDGAMSVIIFTSVYIDISITGPLSFDRKNGR